jgi:deoxyribonuclease-4
MQIGSHVPVAGGLATAGLAYAEKIGATAIQVFAGNPRGWAASPGSPSEDAALRRHIDATGLPVYIHTPYLVNLGSPTPATLEKSVAAVRHGLRRGAEIGARGVVVHTGSAVGGSRYADAFAQLHDHLLPLLDEIPADGPDLLLEPMAGQGRMLCARVEDLGPYLAALDDHPRAAVCLDTCHAFAAGHDLTGPDGVAEMFAALAEHAPGRLRLVHANDSADVRGSNRDRHARIGTGHIGEAGFAALLAHPMGASVPWVLETPGDADAHAADIALLHDLRS